MSRCRFRVRGGDDDRLLGPEGQQAGALEGGDEAIPVRVPLFRDVWAVMERRPTPGRPGGAGWSTPGRSRRSWRRTAAPIGRSEVDGGEHADPPPGEPCWRFQSPMARCSAAMRTLRLLWRSWAATIPAVLLGHAHQVEPVPGSSWRRRRQPGRPGEEVLDADGRHPVPLLPPRDRGRRRAHRQVVVDEEVELGADRPGWRRPRRRRRWLRNRAESNPSAGGVVDVSMTASPSGCRASSAPQGRDLRHRHGATLERDPGRAGRRRRRSRPPRGDRGSGTSTPFDERRPQPGFVQRPGDPGLHLDAPPRELGVEEIVIIGRVGRVGGVA